MPMVGNFQSFTSKQIESLINKNGDIDEEISVNYLNESNPDYLYIDKAWHGIHFILTDSSCEGEKPQSLVILGGDDIGEDFGYGPGKLIMPDDVIEVSNYLKSIDLLSLRKKYNPEVFEKAEIYPQGIWHEKKIEAYEYIERYLKKVIEYYNIAAKLNRAVIKYIC
jgi:hypothetical protein